MQKNKFLCIIIGKIVKDMKVDFNMTIGKKQILGV
jgi:hypothetical protein